MSALHCSFCGKSASRVRTLIKNPNSETPAVYICNECVGVGVCVGILKSDRDEARAGKRFVTVTAPRPTLMHRLLGLR
jgi:ATP-dependent protease Clp ATPase subunit